MIKQEIKEQLAALVDRHNESIGGDNWYAAFRDVLTDMMHLAEERGIDFELALDGATEVYHEERE